MPEPIPQDREPLTHFLKALNRIYSRNFHSVRLLSPCPLPASGPAIVIANHISSADPFLIQGTSHRVIRWMMAKEYFELPVVRTLCDSVGFIPVVRRGRDSSSLKAALRTLDAGNVLGIFPEGRISPTKRMLPFQAGLGVIAHRSGAPIFPAAVEHVPRNLSLLSALVVPHDAVIFYGPKLLAASSPLKMTDFYAAVQMLQNQALASNNRLRRAPFFNDSSQFRNAT